MAPTQGKAQGGAPSQNRGAAKQQAAAKPEIRNPAARTRQTQQQQAKAKAEPKHPGGMSPRSKNLIASLKELLEPYNMGEPEIHSLIKRCNFDDERIQTAVLGIIEEQDSWAHTATASERKEQKEAATERRRKLEKEQEEELERQRQERTKAEDERLRRGREEAARRKQEEAEKKRLVEGAKPMVRNTGGPAWRAKDAEDTPQAEQANDESAEAWTNGNAEAEQEEDAPAAEENWEAPAQAQEEECWEAPGDASPVPDDTPADPPEKASPSTASAENWSQPPPAAAETWSGGHNHWAPSTPAPEHSAPVQAAAQLPAGSAAATQGDGGGASKTPVVVMPAAYASFFASYPEPRVMFGSLNVNVR